tara:strand:- start:1385 stop:1633 length:249 start_codon:yes stop_codon:yes gene_type:complete
MAVGKTYEIVNWDGEKGECRNGHEIIPMSNGFAFCIECSKIEDGYSSLYEVPRNVHPAAKERYGAKDVYSSRARPQPLELTE